MPFGFPHQSVYLGPRNDPDTFNESSLYKPGELGNRYIFNGKQYQRVQLDSGAVAANGVGVVAANQLAYWKVKSTYLVTNDWRQAIGGQGANNQHRNNVAGVFRNAVTAAYYTDIIQTGKAINVASKSGETYVAGDNVVADTTASTARVVVVTAGSAITVDSLGKASGAISGANVPVDLNIAGID